MQPGKSAATPVRGTRNGKAKVLRVPRTTSRAVLAKKPLRDFWFKYPDCEQQLKAWFKETEDAVWKNTNQLKKDYPSASILINNRVVFNIKGNKYRLIVRINFNYQMVWIRFIGTHAQYDKIDAAKI